jgi:hypothetical protein
MSEALEYCSTLNSVIESRFVSNDKPWGPDRLGKSKVGYSFNSGGFRSDEFIPLSKDIPSLLFAGCSQTFGAGVELEKTYAHRIYSHLAEKGEASGFFNIAVPGHTSIQSMLSIFDYINLYGDPNTIVLLMPQLERDAAFFLGYRFEMDYKKQQSAELQVSDFNKFMPVFYRIYKTLYVYCKKNNIRLVSSHWHETDMLLQGKRDIEDYNKYSMGYYLQKDFGDSYQRFIDGKFNKLMFDYAETNKEEKNVMVADDDDHPGNAWHYAMSQSLINRFDL